MDDLLSIPESAKLLGIAVPGLKRWVQLGRVLPVRTRKGEFRFRKSDLITAREKWEHNEGEGRASDPSLG